MDISAEGIRINANMPISLTRLGFIEIVSLLCIYAVKHYVFKQSTIDFIGIR